MYFNVKNRMSSKVTVNERKKESTCTGKENSFSAFFRFTIDQKVVLFKEM